MWNTTSNFLEMEDDPIFFKMEDDLIFWKEDNLNCNQKHLKFKILFYLKMEDDHKKLQPKQLIVKRIKSKKKGCGTAPGYLVYTVLSKYQPIYQSIKQRVINVVIIGEEDGSIKVAR